MSKLSPETFKALLALESAFGQVESVSELKAELSATFPDGARALRFGSEDYPSVLEDLADPPKVLCARGDLSLAERQLRVSIVGSRDASSDRCEAAELVAADLAARGAVIVSGLARALMPRLIAGLFPLGRPRNEPAEQLPFWEHRSLFHGRRKMRV